AGFAARHWRAYAVSAVMLAAIAALTVWIPRQVGHLIDDLVGGRLNDATLAGRLVSLFGAGLSIYFLRVGWRLPLFAARYRMGRELRTRLYRRLAAQGPSFFQQRRTGDLMALATNDIDAVEMAAGEAMLAGFDGSQTLIMVVAMMSLSIDPRLALVALLPFPLMALAFWYISNPIHLAPPESLNRLRTLTSF